jgi:uncharacterized protein (DUF302 family)
MNGISVRNPNRLIMAFAPALVFSGGLYSLAARTSAAPVGARVDIVSRHNFDKTVQQILSAIQSNHMMIVANIDHQNMMSMVGQRIGGSYTMEFGNPQMGKMLFAADPAAGLEMPARIYIFERRGQTVVSYYKPSVGFSNYTHPDFKKMGMMMDEMLQKIVIEGTR